jgi:hypothetical protein
METMIYQGSQSTIAGLPTSAEPMIDEERHSRLGVTSFVISIAVGCLLVGTIGLAGSIHASDRQAGHAHSSHPLIGLAIILLLMAEVPAIGLGIASLVQRRRKRLFGILGLVFSSATFLGVIGLLLLGLFYIYRLRGMH